MPPRSATIETRQRPAMMRRIFMRRTTPLEGCREIEPVFDPGPSSFIAPR
jgi:hypothetical protein